MRLTKNMKDNLYNIIVNRTVSPMENWYEDFQKRFQQTIYDCNPEFIKFLEAYPKLKNSYTFRNLISLSTKGVYHSNSHTAFYVYAPIANITIKPSYRDNYDTKYYKPDNKDYFLKEYLKLYQEWWGKYEEEQEYKKTLETLYESIRAFNTDTALLKAYPEFEQFFKLASITNKPIKYLPSVTDLPASLEKYGLNIKPTVETVEQEIKEEMKEEQYKS